MKNKTIKKWVAGCMAAAFLFTGVVTEPVTASAASKTVTVKTQKQLNAALKNKNVTEVVLKTNKSLTVKISSGDYSSKTLTVSSPKATINNYGDFKKITITDGKSFTERGVDNSILVKDKNSLKLVAGKQASGMNITVSKYAKGGNVTIVDNGDVDTIKVNGKSTVKVSGSSKEAPTITNSATKAEISTTINANVVLNKPATLVVGGKATIGKLTTNADATISVQSGAKVKSASIYGKANDVVINVNGTVNVVTVETNVDLTLSGKTQTAVPVITNVDGTSITSTVKTNLTANADTVVDFKNGAEGSSVKTGSESVKTTVTNNTTDKIAITDSKGTESTVDSGKTETTTPSNESNTSGGSGSSNSGSGSGGSGGSGSGSSSSSSSGSSSSSSSSGSSSSGSSSSGSSSGNNGGSSSGNNGGSSSSNPGGSSSSETSNPLVVTVSAICGDTTVYSDVTTKGAVLYSDYALVAATNIEDCTYEWKFGSSVLSTGKEFALDSDFIGKSICLVVSTTVDGQVVTKTVGMPVIASMVQLSTNKYHDVVVPYNTSIDDLAMFLPDVVDLLDESESYIVSTSLDWEEVEYDPTAANQSFKFTAHAVIPTGYRLMGSDEVTCLVTVLGENVLSYKTSLLSTSDGTDLVNTAVANTEKVRLESYDYESILTGNYLQLDSCTNESSGLGYWVAVNVDFGDVDVSTDTTFGDGRTMGAIDENNQYCKPGATTSSAIVFVDIKALRDEDVTYYFRKGEDGDLTPITFMLKEPRLKVGDLKTPITIPFGLTVDSKDVTKDITTVLEYYLSGNSGDTISFEVEWYLSTPTLVVGDNDILSRPTYDYPVDLEWPVVTVEVGKGECQFRPLSPSKDEMSVTSKSMYIEPVATMEYAVTEKGASADGLKWQKAGLFENLKPNTDYTLYVRIAETDTHYASDKAYTYFKTLLAPTGTSVTSGAIQIKAGEDIKSVLPESTNMLDENYEVIAEHPVSLTWVSDNEYTGEVGTYVYTAEPDGDYSKVFDFSNVKWPVRAITVVNNKPSPEPTKSCTGDFYIFGDTRIGTTGTEDYIPTTISEGVVTLKPTLSLKPVDDVYMLPIDVELNDDTYDVEDLSVTGEDGEYTPYVNRYRYENGHLQFWVSLNKNAEDGIGAAFYVDYDGEGTKYSKSDLIKIDTSRITFLPADPDIPVVVSTPSAIKGLTIQTDETYINTSEPITLVQDNDTTESYSVTATLNYVDGVDCFEEGYNKGYFIPLAFNVDDSVNVDAITVVSANDSVTAAKVLGMEDNTVSILVRSCKGHEDPIQLTFDFDGEGTAWAPYIITINEDAVVLDVPEGNLDELSLSSKLPEGSGLTETDLVCTNLSAGYAGGIVTINGDMQFDITNGNNKVQFFMHVLKGDSVGVAIGTANGITYHVFAQGSDTVAVQDNDVWISKVIELNNSGELSPDNQGAFTIYTLEAGPEDTYNFSKEYNITVESTVFVSNPNE